MAAFSIYTKNDSAGKPGIFIINELKLVWVNLLTNVNDGAANWLCEYYNKKEKVKESIFLPQILRTYRFCHNFVDTR